MTQFEKGHLLSTRHGASSPRQIRPVYRNARRRFLRQVGLRSSDLDQVGRAYLEHYCRLTAKVVLIDNWLDEHGGPLDENGSPRPCMLTYLRAHKAAMGALGKLERHLEVREPDAFETLYAHLRETNGDG
jgi:hypothetical protein